MAVTIKSTKLINKPGIGFVPFSVMTAEFPDTEAATGMLDGSHDLWTQVEEATIIEYVEGETFTVEMSPNDRLKIEISE